MEQVLILQKKTSVSFAPDVDIREAKRTDEKHYKKCCGLLKQVVIENGIENRVEFLEKLEKIIEEINHFFKKGSFEHNKLMAKCLIQKFES